MRLRKIVVGNPSIVALSRAWACPAIAVSDNGRRSLAAWAAVVAVLFAAAAGYVLGARNPVGVWMVAAVVGGFSGAGAVLLRRAGSAGLAESGNPRR